MKHNVRCEMSCNLVGWQWSWAAKRTKNPWEEQKRSRFHLMGCNRLTSLTVGRREIISHNFDLIIILLRFRLLISHFSLIIITFFINGPTFLFFAPIFHVLWPPLTLMDFCGGGLGIYGKYFGNNGGLYKPWRKIPAPHFIGFCGV